MAGLNVIAVMIHHFFQRFKPAIVHIGRREGNIPQSNHPEPAFVNRLFGKVLPTRIRGDTIQSVVMEQFNKCFGTTMTMIAGCAADLFRRIGIGKEKLHAIQFGGRWLVLLLQVLVVTGVSGDQGSFKLGNGIYNTLSGYLAGTECFFE